jgi:hypothetical protein
MRQKVRTITVMSSRDGSIFKKVWLRCPPAASESASDLHSEAADRRTSQGMKLREEQIPRTL